MEDDQQTSLPEKTQDGTPILHVCHGRVCGQNAKYIMDRVEQVKEKGYCIEARSTICFGLCPYAANVKYKGKIHSQMNPIKVSELIKKKTRSFKAGFLLSQNRLFSIGSDRNNLNRYFHFLLDKRDIVF